MAFALLASEGGRTVYCVSQGGGGGRGGSTSSQSIPEPSPLSSAGAAVLRMSGDKNPASKPTPVQDVQGDGRWMSLVSDSTRSLGVREVGASREPLLHGVLIFTWVGSQVLFVQPVQAGWGRAWSMRAIDSFLVSLQHQRFVADSKDKEAEVVFIGDSLVQLMHQCEVRLQPFPPSSLRHVPSLASTLGPDSKPGKVRGYRNTPGSRNLRIPCKCSIL